MIVRSPDGYVFKIVDEEKAGDPIASLNLNCTDLESTTIFWSDILKMKVFCARKRKRKRKRNVL